MPPYNIPGGTKTFEHSHIMQQSSGSESAEKHVCNEQKSSNMSIGIFALDTLVLAVIQTK